MTRHPKNKKWTIKELDAVPVDWKGDTISDGDGLSGEVRVNGGSVSIVFRFAFKWKGKVKWHYCGAYPTVDLSAIREERNKARVLVKQGIDPRDHKVAARIEAKSKVDAIIIADAQKQAEAYTFLDLFEQWIRDGVKRLNDNKDLKLTFGKNALPFFGNIKINELTEHDLRKRYRSIIDSERIRAAVVLSNDITQMLKWAEKRQPWRGLLINGNPADLIDMSLLLPDDYEPECDRILSDQEIIKLSETFDRMTAEYTNSKNKYKIERPLKREYQFAIWIMLSSLTRVGETLMAEWKHIDFERREWFIPAVNTKGKRGKKRDQLVSLSDFTLNKFIQLKELTGRTRWVFPGRNEINHIKEKAITQQVGDRQVSFKNRNELAKRLSSNSLVLDKERGDWSPHDLRRTGATVMQRLGVNRDIINLCQNHVTGSKIDQVYLLHDYRNEKKDAWSRLGNWLDALLSSA